AGRRRAARSRSPAHPRGPRRSASERHVGTSAPRRPSLAELVADEPAHHDVLAGLGGHFLHQLTDRLLAFRVLDEHLLHERVVLEELLHLAVDDLVPHRLGLPLVLHLLTIDGALTLDHVRRHIGLVDGDRRHRGNVHGKLTAPLDQLLVARNEVGLTVHLDHDADLVVRVQVHPDHALARLTLGPLGCLRRTACTQHVDRRLHVAVRFLERLLALHHPGARALAKLLYHSSSNRGHYP